MCRPILLCFLQSVVYRFLFVGIRKVRFVCLSCLFTQVVPRIFFESMLYCTRATIDLKFGYRLCLFFLFVRRYHLFLALLIWFHLLMVVPQFCDNNHPFFKNNLNSCPIASEVLLKK
jgi:hypothetical protein